ncbi:MAG TPA: HAMP domain-containing sensor histidine kinase [Ktedonobacteraceae bacterium]|jgi:signal transduction histidine kinase|nr:HAMP domain-containing sensor histidine kinase [Ktedonobacteraceae bacterium]
MEVEHDLQTLLLFACNLVGCSAACLSLHCSERALCHPLLTFLPPHLSYVASRDDPSLLLFHDELMLARFDLTLLYGQISYLDSLPGSDYLSAALVPLEGPSGSLGLLLLVDSHAQTFLAGERLLVSQLSSLFAQKLEQVLSDFCLASISPQISLTTAQEQGTFFSMMSHELRVPLTAIKGYACLLQAYGSPLPLSQELPSPSASSAPLEREGFSSAPPLPALLQRQYLQGIIEQVDHLEVLLGDLLDVSRLQSGRLSLRQQRVDVPQLCQQALLLMQSRVDQQQPGLYRFSCHCSSLPLLARADSARFQQVLINLLENAVKYSPSGGSIDLFASRQLPEEDDVSPLICVTVCDRGIGIPLQQQASLFRPFSRSAQSASLNVSGSGLGLYISRLLVEAMGGTILLQSNEGSGTRVTFFLPACGE